MIISFYFYPFCLVIRLFGLLVAINPRIDCVKEDQALCAQSIKSEQSSTTDGLFFPFHGHQFSLGNSLFSTVEAAVDYCNYGFNISLTIQCEY